MSTQTATAEPAITKRSPLVGVMRPGGACRVPDGDAGYAALPGLINPTNGIIGNCYTPVELKPCPTMSDDPERLISAARYLERTTPVKTVKIEWTEVSRHERTVNVPDDFDADNSNLEDNLAQLDNDGFQFLEREIDSVKNAGFDPDAEELDLTKHVL